METLGSGSVKCRERTRQRERAGTVSDDEVQHEVGSVGGSGRVEYHRQLLLTIVDSSVGDPTFVSRVVGPLGSLSNPSEVVGS